MAAIQNEVVRTAEIRKPLDELPNGAGMAAFLASGLGAFAMGVFVLLNETGIFAAPTLYEPAGGVSGRTSFAVIAWLIAWGVLHARWKARDVPARRVLAGMAILIAFGILATFPPIWRLVS